MIDPKVLDTPSIAPLFEGGAFFIYDLSFSLERVIKFILKKG